MLRFRVSVALVVAATSWGLSSCLDLAGSICRADETVLVFKEGGSDCVPRRDSDADCADGERARRMEATGRIDCVVDEA